MNTSTYNIFFTNLANPLKISIILNLRQKEKNVNELAKELGVEQSKASHALASLKKCNIVKMKQKGKQRIYFLNSKTIIPMLKLIDEHATNYCNCKTCNAKCTKNFSKKNFGATKSEKQDFVGGGRK